MHGILVRNFIVFNRNPCFLFVASHFISAASARMPTATDTRIHDTFFWSSQYPLTMLHLCTRTFTHMHENHPNPNN
jgi:hypothetical protein